MPAVCMIAVRSRLDSGFDVDLALCKLSRGDGDQIKTFSIAVAIGVERQRDSTQVGVRLDAKNAEDATLFGEDLFDCLLHTVWQGIGSDAPVALARELAHQRGRRYAQMGLDVGECHNA